MVRYGPASWCLVSSRSATERVPAQSRGQFGGVFDPILGGSEGIRQPEQLHGGFGQSPTWTFTPNAAGPLTHQSHGPNLGVTSTPFLNQAFNASTSSQQYTNQRPPSNPSLNYSGAPPSLHPTEYRYSDTIVNRSPQVRLSGTSKDNQSTTPQRRTNSVGGAHVSDKLTESQRSGYTQAALPLATHRAPGGVQPPWQDESRVHSFTPAIHEPINSVNNLPTNSQASGIPAQRRQSTPGPIGIIPDMSALSRAASSAFNYSSTPDSLLPVYRPDPVERFPTSYFGASPAPPLGDDGQLDHDDYEASAPEPLAFQSMPLYRLPHESTYANHLVSRTNRKRPQRRTRGPELVIYGGTPSSAPRFSAYTYQGSARPQLPHVSRATLTSLIPPRTSSPAIPPLPPGASLPDHLKHLLPHGSVAFSRSDDGQVDGAMADEARPPALPVFQPENQSYGLVRSESPPSELTGSYEELSKRRQDTDDNKRIRLQAREPSPPAPPFPFKQGVARMQSASVLQSPAPSGPRRPDEYPMAVTPAAMSLVRRLRTRENEEHRDGRPHPMQMQLQPCSIPKPILVRPMCSINL